MKNQRLNDLMAGATDGGVLESLPTPGAVTAIPPGVFGTVDIEQMSGGRKWQGLAPDRLRRQLPLGSPSGKFLRFTFDEARAWGQYFSTPLLRPEHAPAYVLSICVAGREDWSAQALAANVIQGLALTGYSVLLVDHSPAGGLAARFGARASTDALLNSFAPHWREQGLLEQQEMAETLIAETCWPGVTAVYSGGEYAAISRVSALARGVSQLMDLRWLTGKLCTPSIGNDVVVVYAGGDYAAGCTGLQSILAADGLLLFANERNEFGLLRDHISQDLSALSDSGLEADVQDLMVVATGGADADSVTGSTGAAFVVDGSSVFEEGPFGVGKRDYAVRSAQWYRLIRHIQVQAAHCWRMRAELVLSEVLGDVSAELACDKHHAQ